MKKIIAGIIALCCMVIFVSCNSGLNNEKAKAVFLKANKFVKVNNILLNKMDYNSYIARVNYSFPSGDTYEHEYIFTKWDTGWNCSQSKLPYDPDRWK